MRYDTQSKSFASKEFLLSNVTLPIHNKDSLLFQICQRKERILWIYFICVGKYSIWFKGRIFYKHYCRIPVTVGWTIAIEKSYNNQIQRSIWYKIPKRLFRKFSNKEDTRFVRAEKYLWYSNKLTLNPLLRDEIAHFVLCLQKWKRTRLKLLSKVNVDFL